MNTTGYFIGAQENGDELIISFSVAKDTELNCLDGNLDISAESICGKRSIQANRYLWKLCELIGYKLDINKTEAYQNMLYKYGEWYENIIPIDAVPTMIKYTEHTKILWTDDDEACVRTHIGSSKYDKRKFSQLLSGTIEEARQLGISTWSDEEVNYLMENWDGKK